MPFSRALRIETFKRPVNAYSIQLSIKTVAPVRRGDALLARFYVRTPGAPLAASRTEFVFERAHGDYLKSVLHPVAAGFLWQRVDVPFTAKSDSPAGQAQANFRLGFDPQTIEIGGVQLLRLEGRAAASVYSSPITYDGRGRYAPWRLAAAMRIERERKAELTVQVRDAAGRPVRGAEVSLRLTRHAFLFGGAVNARYLRSGPETADKRRYRAEILRLFNAAVVDNALKWSQWDSQKAWGLDTVRWLRENGLVVRGHNLVWPGWSHLPEGLRAWAQRPEELSRRVDDHIREEGGALRGLVQQWDVVNEPYDNRDLTGVLGRESLVRWFRLARAADPAARLFVNDTGVLNDAGENKAHQGGYADIIRYLLDSGAPLDGIGLQAHFDSRLTAPAQLLPLLDRFGRMGKPLLVTEFDVDAPDEGLRADYVRDFMTVCFSHPAVEGVMLWEFWEGLVSGNSSASVIFHKDWSLRPSGRVWEDLVLKQWRTRAAGRTGRDGRFSVRGFLGEYEVEVRAGGRSRKLTGKLAREGAAWEVELDAKETVDDR